MRGHAAITFRDSEAPGFKFEFVVACISSRRHVKTWPSTQVRVRGSRIACLKSMWGRRPDQGVRGDNVSGQRA